MRDETRDALLIAIADLAIQAAWGYVANVDGMAQADDFTAKARELFQRAKHEAWQEKEARNA